MLPCTAHCLLTKSVLCSFDVLSPLEIIQESHPESNLRIPSIINALDKMELTPKVGTSFFFPSWDITLKNRPCIVENTTLFLGAILWILSILLPYDLWSRKVIVCIFHVKSFVLTLNEYFICTH